MKSNKSAKQDAKQDENTALLLQVFRGRVSRKV